MLMLQLEGPVVVHRIARALSWAVLLVALLTLANFISQAIVPDPAQAGVLDVCDTNYQMPDPQNATITYDGNYSRVQGADAYVQPDNSPYVGPGGTGSAYGTGGLTWSTYGTSVCNPMDYAYNITTMVSGFFLSGLIAFASMMGFLLNIAFTTDITKRILDNSTVTSMMREVDNTLFNQWGALIMLIGILIVIGLVLRRRIKEGATNLLWIAFASAMVVTVSTTSLMPTIGGKINDATSSISTSVLLLFNGGDCKNATGNASANSTITCMTTKMTSQFVTPIWSVGAAGQEATERLNAITAVDEKGKADTINWAADDKATIKVFWDKKGNTAVDDVQPGNFGSIHLPPKGVVPTEEPDGVPTTSEYLRWTQTYTGAELKAMQDNPSMRCRSTSSPSKLEDLDEASYKGGELCMKKWAVRSAIMYGLKNHDPSSYNAATGRDDLNSRIAPAILAYPVTGSVVVSLSLVGMLMFAYQLEMALYLILCGLFFFGSIIKGPRLMADWCGWVAATAVKRIGLGLMLGVLMFLFSIANSIFDTGLVNGLGFLGVVFLPLLQQFFLIAGLVALFVMWKKFRKWSLQTTRLEKYGTNKIVKTTKSAATKALSVGGAATAGALTGGVGAAALGGAGAAIKKTPEDGGGGDAIMSNIHSASRQGRMVKQNRLAKQSSMTQAADAQSQENQALDQADQHGQTAQSFGQQANVVQGEVSDLSGQHTTAQKDAELASSNANQALRDFTVNHTADGQAINHRLETANTAHVENTAAAQGAESNLSTFLTDRNLTVSHRMDSNGNLQVRDLKTGEVATEADPSKYDPNMQIHKLLPNSDDQLQYASLQGTYSKASNAVEQSGMDKTLVSQDLDRAVSKEQAKAANMSVNDIEKSYPKEMANDLKRWKHMQTKAQSLSAHAQSVQSQLSQKQADLATVQKGKTQSLNAMASAQLQAQNQRKAKESLHAQSQKLNNRQLHDLLGGRGGRR